MKKTTHLFFKNEIFFPKLNLPQKLTTGYYIGQLFYNGFMFFCGALILSIIGLIIANLTGYFMYEQRFSDIPMYNIDGGIGQNIVTITVLILSLYGLFSFIHYSSNGFKYLNYLLSRSNNQQIKLKTIYDKEVLKISKELKKQLISQTLTKKEFSYEKEYNSKIRDLKFKLKNKFIEEELHRNRNITPHNIESEKLKLERYFNSIIK